MAEIGLDITDAINFAFQTVPGRDDISPLGILTFQANPNLELLGSYDSNGAVSYTHLTLPTTTLV